MLHRPALRYSIRFRLPETAMAPESWLDRRGHNRRNEKIHRRRTAGRLADIALDLDLAGREQAQRRRIDAVLDFEDALRQRLRRVVIADGHRALHHDRTRVGLGDDEVYRRTRQFDAGAQGLAVRVEAGEGRQQRGMDVEHPPVPGLGEFGGEQAHESAEAYQLDAVLVERGLQHRLEAG